MKVFISYAHEDYESVKEYVSRLKAEQGVDLFWDKNIPKGENFVDVLARETLGAAILVVFVSSGSCRSRFTIREVLMADSNAAIRLIPVYLEDPASLTAADQGLLFVLKELQGILAYETDFETAYQQLINTIRPAIPPPKTSTPIIATMGTKGGVGKSIVTAAMAELIVSAGYNVMIIDADIEAAGVSKYIGGRARNRPNVWSVLDSAYSRTPSGISGDRADKGAWKVTPEYLEEKRFGDIYLIPARLANDMRIGWNAMADIRQEERNEKALEILDELVTRAQNLPVEIDCILIDSGAENNPLVSAAFVRATYGFIISSPNPEFAKEVSVLC